MRGYLDLMKLRVVELLLVSTLPAMVLAAEGLPNFGLVAATIFATIIGLLSLVLFWVFTTPLATLLALIAIVFYVVVYTMALKQRTSQNIVWGGAAGCMPVLIGWAAVENSLSMTSWAFFFVIFFWTPPHFWALAIKYKDDYAAAGTPMLPVVATKGRVLGEMWFHTTLMIASSIWLISAANLPTWSMLVTIGLGLVFAVQLIALKEGSPNYAKVAGKIFQWSITYLSLLSVVLVAAQLLS